MQHTMYLFSGQETKFASAVFSTFEKAKNWVEQNHLSGMLIEYPIDESCYDWAIQQGHFTQLSAIDKAPIFIERFVSIYQKRWHFVHGEIVSSSTYQDLIYC